MHYYQFNIGDYASHTQHLDPMEDLAYRRMLDFCYLNECGLPESVDSIARAIRMREHCNCIAIVLQEFFYLHENGTWHSKRVDKEIEKVNKKSEARSLAANKRWKNSNANALQTECKSNATQDTRHKTQDTLPIVIAPTVVEAKKNTKGSRLPDDWFLPKAWGEWALEQGWEIEAIRLEADKFGDYWRAKSGKDACKRDWFATWKNWIRNAKKPPPLHHHQTKSFSDTHTDRSWAKDL